MKERDKEVLIHTVEETEFLKELKRMNHRYYSLHLHTTYKRQRVFKYFYDI